MGRLLNILLLSCKKATELIEKQQYFGLSAFERVRLRIHLRVCHFCTRYKQQSLFLHRLLSAHSHHHHLSDLPAEQENSALKEKIINEIEKL